MTYSIVIPVYNSEKSLSALYEKLKANLISDFEIIFVNDGSQDKSLEILTHLASQDSRVLVIDLVRNLGQQHALYIGIQQAKGAYIVTMDDDLQHPVHMIPRMRMIMDLGYDLVYAVPQDQHAGYRHLGSKLTGLFFKRFFKALGDKRVSSFRMFSQDVQCQLNAQYPFVYISAMMLPKVKSVANIPFKSLARPHGQSGYTILKLFKLFSRLYFYYGPGFLEPIRPKLHVKEDIKIYENDYDTWRGTVSG